MSGKDIANPFLQNRLRASQASSLLSHGDENYSMYKMVNKNNRLYQSSVTESQKSREERILWKYEKEFYEVDETGHSLAEESFDERISKETTETPDFWKDLLAPVGTKNSNPFEKGLRNDDQETASHFSSSSFSGMRSSYRKSEQIDSRKSDRRSKCQQAIKLKHFIKSKKTPELASNDQASKFSLVKMYKSKLTEDLQTGKFIPAAKQLGKQKSRHFQYPQSIFIKELQYFKIPLE